MSAWIASRSIEVYLSQIWRDLVQYRPQSSNLFSMESSAASYSSSSSSSSSSSVAGSGAVDPSPLLSRAGSGRDDDWNRRFGRRAGLRGAARLLRRAGSRRSAMREPSIRVRETAAEQLEEAQSDWAYSRPVVVLDIVWNLAFVGAAAVVMVLSRGEAPSMPLRLWIAGYAMQCLLHIVCVQFEYRRRQELQLAAPAERVGGGGGEGLVGEVPPEGGGGGFGAQQVGQDDRTSVAKHLESANTMFSFIWWIIGFYWVSAGSKTLPYESPLLYWLCIVFLAFDVFFVVFCVALACIIGIAVCCCLPCIIAILYAVADQDGATEEDIRQLPRYKFRRYNNIEKGNGEVSEPFGGIMTECGSETPMEHVLSAEDAECCICLTAYEDGVELRELPCCHHFHCACIDKWLYINATCPLCKFNIVKSIAHDREEV